MSTSGTTSYSTTTTEIITDALLMINAAAFDQSVESADFNFALRALNRLVKHFENKAQHIWERKEGYLFPQPSQASYTLGVTGDHCAAGSYVQMALTVAAVATNTTLTVLSTTGVNANDKLGLVLDTGSVYWTTVSGAPTSTVITIAGSVPSSSAIGQYIWTYTTDIIKPLEIPSMRYRDTTSLIDLKLEKLAYDDYQMRPNKTTSPSSALNYMYQRNTGSTTVYLWPAPLNVSKIFPITYTASIQDFDNVGDNPDVPQEWYRYLVHALACDLCPVYGRLGDQSYKDLKMNTEEIQQEVLAYDNETSYISLRPDRHMN